MVRLGKVTAAVCAAVMMAGAAGLPCIGGLADGSAIKASAGSLNSEDLAQLQKYAAGWNVWMEPSVADVAVDGRINGEDIALLQKYLAGWEVQLGKKGGTS